MGDVLARKGAHLGHRLRGSYRAEDAEKIEEFWALKDVSFYVEKGD